MGAPIKGVWICKSGLAWWIIEFTDDGCIGTSSNYNDDQRGIGSCYYKIQGNLITFLYDDPETYKYRINGDTLDIETPFRLRGEYRRATKQEFEKLHVPACISLGIR